MSYNIAVIPGDGIGPEIIREARKVLDRIGTVYGLSLIHISGSYKGKGTAAGGDRKNIYDRFL